MNENDEIKEEMNTENDDFEDLGYFAEEEGDLEGADTFSANNYSPSLDPRVSDVVSFFRPFIIDRRTLDYEQLYKDLRGDDPMAQKDAKETLTYSLIPLVISICLQKLHGELLNYFADCFQQCLGDIHAKIAYYDPSKSPLTTYCGFVFKRAIANTLINSCPSALSDADYVMSRYIDEAIQNLNDAGNYYPSTTELLEEVNVIHRKKKSHTLTFKDISAEKLESALKVRSRAKNSVSLDSTQHVGDDEMTIASTIEDKSYETPYTKAVGAEEHEALLHVIQANPNANPKLAKFLYAYFECDGNLNMVADMLGFKKKEVNSLMHEYTRLAITDIKVRKLSDSYASLSFSSAVILDIPKSNILWEYEEEYDGPVDVSTLFDPD